MKKRKLIFLLPIAAMALGACGNKEEPKDEPGQQEEGGGGGGEQEETVSLAIKNKANFELEVEATKQLEAELKGATGDLAWSSSAVAIATVDATGKVTAVAPGEATISVTFGDYVDSVVVTVKEKDVPPTPVSFEDAYKEAAKLSDNGSTSTAEAYTMIGIVVARQGNSFYMQNGDYTIEIYNQLINEAPAVIGKEVKAVTTLKNYYGNIESSEVTSLEYTGNHGEVKTTAVANKTALEAVRINNPIVPAKLTVVKVDSKYTSRSSDGKLTVKIGEDTDSVTLIMSKNCVNDAAAAVLNNAQPGDVLTVSKGITAVYKSAYQISLSDDSVVTKEVNPDKEVLSITIEGALVNTEFEEGDAYSAAGLSVLAHCKDESTFTANVTITLDKEVAALGDTKLTASAEFEGNQVSKDFDITVIPKLPDPVKDVTFNKIGEQADLVDGKYLIATTYQDTTSKEDVTYVYHGKDTTKETVKVTTADSIVGTDGMAGVQIEAVPDGYTLKILNGANKGKYMGGKSDGNGLVFSDTPVLNTITFNNGVPTIMSEGKTLTFNSNADQLRFRYMANVNKPVSLYWAGTLTPVLTSLELTNGPTKTEYVAGEIFEPAGMVITAKYNHGGQDKIIEAADYTIDKTTLAVGDEFVTVSYEENGVTKTVQVPVTVTKAPVPVTGVTLNKTELSMKVNEEDFTLEATVAPADADDPTVTWSLSKEGVVTVNNGVLHAVADGEVTVTATAGDYHADCVVTVAPADKVLSGIEVTTQPAKTQYVAGESFDPTDMVITASYSSGHNSEPVTGYTFSTAPLKEADTTVEIDYNGQKAYVTITVSPAPVLDSISVANAQGKTAEYTVGDVISKDDIVVTAHYTQGKQDAVVTDYTISLTEGLTLSDTSATITYVEGGVEKTATYTFTVSEKQAAKGTLENPYTVSELLEAYKDLPKYDNSSEEGKNNCFSNERVYVVGTVTGYSEGNYTTLDKDLKVYKPVVPTEFFRACKGDVAIFEGYVENYTDTFELASNNNHVGAPTCAAIVSRGTSTISLDAETSENASVTFEGTATNASQYSFTVTANEGFQVSKVEFAGKEITGQDGTYTVTITDNAKIKVYTANAGEKLPEVYKEISFAAEYSNKSLSSYTDEGSYTMNGFTVSIQNFNNNKNSADSNWNCIKCGRKKPKSGSSLSIAKITTASSIDKAISEIAIDFGGITKNKLNSAKLLISTSADMSSPTTIDFTNDLVANKKNSIVIEAPIENAYYQLVFDCLEGSDNGFVAVKGIEFKAVL